MTNNTAVCLTPRIGHFEVEVGCEHCGGSFSVSLNPSYAKYKSLAYAFRRSCDCYLTRPEWAAMCERAMAAVTEWWQAHRVAEVPS